MKFVSRFTQIAVRFKHESLPKQDWIVCPDDIEMVYSIDDKTKFWLSFESSAPKINYFKGSLDKVSSPIINGTSMDTVAFRWAQRYYEVQFECSTMANLFSDLLKRKVLERNKSPLSANWELSTDSSSDEGCSDEAGNRRTTKSTAFHPKVLTKKQRKNIPNYTAENCGFINKNSSDEDEIKQPDKKQKMNNSSDEDENTKPEKKQNMNSSNTGDDDEKMSSSTSVDDVDLPPAKCEGCGGIGPKGMICSTCEDNCLMFDIDYDSQE